MTVPGQTATFLLKWTMSALAPISEVGKGWQLRVIDQSARDHDA
jgi:hypothetical protein